MVTPPRQLKLLHTPEPVKLVQGLEYVPDYIPHNQQTELLQHIDAQPWSQELKRRVQHYGYRYNYKSRSVDPTMYLGALPDWLTPIAQRLHREGYINDLPDQVIINEYQPGQGITPHVDCTSCFTDTIISLSLGSPCIMDFIQKSMDEKKSLWLEPRSLLVMRNEARYQWQHTIPARKTDTWQGNKIWRQRRVSLTFRKVILADKALIS